MPRIITIAVVLLAATLTGCGHQKTWVAADPMALTAKPAGYDMPVSRGGTNRAHKVLGEISITTQVKSSWSTESSLDRAIDEVKKEAIRRGGDAVVGLKTTERDRKGRTHMTLTGQLILFTAPPISSSRG